MIITKTNINAAILAVIFRTKIFILCKEKFFQRNNQSKRIQSCRGYTKNQVWWENVQNYDDKLYEENFRVSKETSDFVLS